MATYHVFVEGSVDASAAGLERLAAAIAEHYGLPVASLRQRIATGRFRVKGNCDRTTADMYVRDLTRLGARCVIEEASPGNRSDTPLPFPTMPPPMGDARPTTPPPMAPPRPSTPPPMGGYQSGLSAAFSGAVPAATLGALEGSGESFTLGSVDGKDDEAAPEPAAFEPPGVGQSASIGPAPTKKPAAKAKPKDVPLDIFAPPDAADDALNVDLAPDEVERSANKRASIPPINVPIAEPAPSTRRSQPSMEPHSPSAALPTGGKPRPSIQPPTISSPASASGLAEPKTRFALGVVIAIVLGFVPAHFIASMREHSAFEEIDRKVIATQTAAETDDAYAALDKFRDEQMSRKHDDRRSIAITALLVWALAGGVIGYVWFRRIPWDRFET